MRSGFDTGDLFQYVSFEVGENMFTSLASIVDPRNVAMFPRVLSGSKAAKIHTENRRR